MITTIAIGVKGLAHVDCRARRTREPVTRPETSSGEVGRCAARARGQQDPTLDKAFDALARLAPVGIRVVVPPGQETREPRQATTGHVAAAQVGYGVHHLAHGKDGVAVRVAVLVVWRQREREPEHAIGVRVCGRAFGARRNRPTPIGVDAEAKDEPCTAPRNGTQHIVGHVFDEILVRGGKWMASENDRYEQKASAGFGGHRPQCARRTLPPDAVVACDLESLVLAAHPATHKGQIYAIAFSNHAFTRIDQRRRMSFPPSNRDSTPTVNATIDMIAMVIGSVSNAIVAVGRF